MSKSSSIDEQLVRLLGQDARQGSEALAKQLKVSAATVRRKIGSLVRNGTLRIAGVVDPSKFGLPLAVVITLDVAHTKLGTALETLTSWPEVRWVASTTGRFDIIAIARFSTTDDLSAFITNKLSRLDGLKDSETFVCLEVKKGRYVPLT